MSEIKPKTPGSAKPPDLPKPTPKKPVTSAQIAELQRVYEALTAEDKERLAQAGVEIPVGDLSEIDVGDHKWGLRCTKCNKVALYFIGTSWKWGDQVFDVPPAIPGIAWTQRLHPSQIDRNSPRCQHCGVTVPMQSTGAFDYGRVIETASGYSKLVVIAEFEGSRDKAMSKQHVRDFHRTQYAKQVDMGDVSHHYTQEPREPSKVFDEQQGAGFSKELQKVAEETGAADYIPTR